MKFSVPDFVPWAKAARKKNGECGALLRKMPQGRASWACCLQGFRGGTRMLTYASNFFVWGILAFFTLLIGYYAFVRPHRPDSTKPKDR